MRRDHQPTSAVVIGAGIAGLAAARVLSDYVDRVVVVERDQLNECAESRRGVPQGRHAHALLEAGRVLLERWFPGLGVDLEAAGAVRMTSAEGWRYQGGGYRLREDVGIEMLSMSRPLLESTVRRHLSTRTGVTIRDGVAVGDLLVEDGRVTGVTVDGRPCVGDLVVDCSGRNTRFLDLERVGFPQPPVSHIAIDMAYGTRVLRRRPDDLDGMFAVVVSSAAEHHRIGVLLPAEDDRWILTFGGFHGDRPPSDDDGFARFARSLPSPVMADVLERAEALSPVMTHRMATSQRRHFERLRRRPSGYLALGDAICSFNPIYGQGMSSALLQAARLEVVVRRHGLTGTGMSREFYRRAAKVVDVPWTISAGGDFTHPSTTGPKPAGTDLVNRYLAKAVRAAHTSPEVDRQLLDPEPGRHAAVDDVAGDGAPGAAHRAPLAGDHRRGGSPIETWQVPGAGMSVSLAADAAAVTATVLSAIGALPQLRRIVGTGDIAGVSAGIAPIRPRTP